MNKKILLVEDETVLLETLSYNLNREGYEVITANDGVRGLERARHEHPDLIILDLMLPQLDGLEVCRQVRRDSAVPILILTAKADEVDKVVGLEIGADDYLTKPFGMHELVARIKALLRRAEQRQVLPSQMDNGSANGASSMDLVAEVLSAGPLQIDMMTRQVICRGEQLELPPKQFDLLVYLVRNRGRVLSRDLLLQRIWGYTYSGDTRTVDVHIHWLREKIETDPGSPQLIQAVRGVGYCFRG